MTFRGMNFGNLSVISAAILGALVFTTSCKSSGTKRNFSQVLSSGASVQKKASANVEPGALRPAHSSESGSSESSATQGSEQTFSLRDAVVSTERMPSRLPVAPLQRNDQIFQGGSRGAAPVSYTPSMVGANLYVRTTAYSHKEADSLPYGKLSAAGGELQYTSTVRSAAADWSRFPLGTRFRIQGQPYQYVIDDYGSALVGTNTIDIYKPTLSAMNEWGAKNVPIQIIQWGCFEKSRQILDSRKHVKHADHVRQMLRDIEARYTHGVPRTSGNTTAAVAISRRSETERS